MNNYNNFWELCTSNQPQSVSVFNIKLSPGTLKCFKEYKEFICENDNEAAEDDENAREVESIFEDRVAACLVNDMLHYPENQNEYHGEEDLKRFCEDACKEAGLDGYIDTYELADTAYLILDSSDPESLRELPDDYEPFQPSPYMRQVKGQTGENKWWLKMYGK